MILVNSDVAGMHTIHAIYLWKKEKGGLRTGANVFSFRKSFHFSYHSFKTIAKSFSVKIVRASPIARNSWPAFVFSLDVKVKHLFFRH